MPSPRPSRFRASGAVLEQHEVEQGASLQVAARDRRCPGRARGRGRDVAARLGPGGTAARTPDEPRPRGDRPRRSRDGRQLEPAAGRRVGRCVVGGRRRRPIAASASAASGVRARCAPTTPAQPIVDLPPGATVIEARLYVVDVGLGIGRTAARAPGRPRRRGVHRCRSGHPGGPEDRRGAVAATRVPSIARRSGTSPTSSPAGDQVSTPLPTS